MKSNGDVGKREEKEKKIKRKGKILSNYQIHKVRGGFRVGALGAP